MRWYLLSIKELLPVMPASVSEETFISEETLPDGTGHGLGCGRQGNLGKEMLWEKESAAADSGKLLAKAFDRVDAHRRERAARMKPGRGQAASLGAGLLLQLAVGEALRTAQDMPEERQRSADIRNRKSEDSLHLADIRHRKPEDSLQPADIQNRKPEDSLHLADIRYRKPEDSLQPADIQHKNPEEENSLRQDASEMKCSMERYSVSSLLARLEAMPFLPLRYRYGSRGKPYLQEYPFYFSLSHSGDYVFCVLSGQEVGADIQQHRKCDTKRLTERFFSEQEKVFLERARQSGCGGEELFFYLWARKEALGKLTGGGIGDTAGANMLPGEEEIPEGRRLVWEETSAIQGYSIAACRYGN